MSSEPDEKTRVATIKNNAEGKLHFKTGTKDRRVVYKLTFVRSMNRPIIFMKQRGSNAARQTTGYQKYEHEANTGPLSRKYNTD